VCATIFVSPVPMTMRMEGDLLRAHLDLMLGTSACSAHLFSSNSFPKANNFIL
jgi:hypothetical protein